MLKRVINFSLVSVLCLSALPMSACSDSGDDGNSLSFGSFGTTQTTTFSTTVTEEESGDGDGDGDTTTGDGDGDGDPTTTTGDGDGDAGDGDPSTGDGDTDCPPGEFGCPCDNGQCAAGLSCGIDNTCGLGGGDGDGDPTTGDGDGDPWDPANCVMPSVPVTITGLPGEMCSAPCTDDSDCPAGPPGTQPACALVFDMDVDPSQCALICDPLNDACSPGASCKAIPDQPDVGICTYP